MKKQTLLLLPLIGLGLVACNSPEPEIRQFQMVLVAVNKKALQDSLATSADGVQFAKPFLGQGQANCRPTLWVPRISALPASALGGSGAKATDLGIFDKEQLVEASQNPVQRIFRQRPTLAELEDAASTRLTSFSVPEAFVDLPGSTPQVTDSLAIAQRFAGKAGIVLYRDETARSEAAIEASKAAAQIKGAKGDARPPAKALAFPDVDAYRQQVHDLLCDLPNQDSGPIPSVMVIGLAGDISRPPGTSTVQIAGQSPGEPAGPQPSADAVRAFDRGLIAARAQDYDLAVKEFSSALTTQPNYAAARGGRGTAYLRLKKYESAEADLLEAIRLNEKNYIFRYNLAALHSMRQEAERGFIRLDEALARGYAKSETESGDAERAALKFDKRGDEELAFLRKNKTEYCAILERHKIPCQR